MTDKAHRVKMAQIVAYAKYPELKRFPGDNHVVVKKELKRNFGNLKQEYDTAVVKLFDEKRPIPIPLPIPTQVHA